MATSDVVLRLRSEFDATGAQQAVESSGKVTQAASRESAAFEGAAQSSMQFEVSKRRLIRTTSALTGDLAMTAVRGGSVGQALQTAGTSVMFLTHSLGSLAGPLGIALLLGGAMVEGLIKFGEKEEKATEKTEALSKGLEEAKKNVEAARSAFQAGLFSKEQLAAIQMYADSLEKQKNAFKPIEEVAKAQKGLTELLAEEASIRRKIGLSLAQQKVVEEDRNFGAIRRKELVDAELSIQSKLGRQLEDVLVKEREQQTAGNRTLAARAGLAKATSKLTEEEVKMFAEGRQAMDRAVSESVGKQKQLKLDEVKEDAKLSDERVAKFAMYARSFRASSTELISDEIQRRRMQVKEEAAIRTANAQEEIRQGKVTADVLVLIEQEKENKLNKIDRDATKSRLSLQVAAAQQVAGVMGQLADFMEKSGSQSFRAMKALRVAEAVINTAAGVAQALGTIPPPFSYIAAAAVAAAGAIQVATILRTEPGSAGAGPGVGSIGGGATGSTTGGTGPGSTAGSIGGGRGGGGGGPTTVNLYFEKGSIALQALSFDDLPPGSARRVGRDIVREISQQINGLGGALRS